MSKKHKIDPVSPEALVSFIHFGIERMGFENVVDILDMLFGMKEDEVRDISEGRLHVYSQLNGKLLLSDIDDKGIIDASVHGKRIENKLERSKLVKKLHKQGMDIKDISDTIGMCTATVRKYMNGDVVKTYTSKSKNMWTSEIVDDLGNTITIYGFKNGACSFGSSKLEWGWVSPNGDVYGSIVPYDASGFLHIHLADLIVSKELVDDSYFDGSNGHSILERLGWIKFENSRVLADLDISDLNGTYKPVATLITDKQQKFIADYMEQQYLSHHSCPNIGCTPNEYPVTYLRLRSMDLERFRYLVTH